MCGINLIIDKTKSLDPAIIHSMTHQTRHRGPDESIVKIIECQSGTYHIGANRLKITDQSEYASQPFLSQDKKYALLFNGEIYNFYSLKNQLLNQGIQFYSQSDTEVLFHWLMVFGKSRINELEGMFAFVFIDFEQDQVLVARDRFAIKPIYYYDDSQRLIISSEIQSIVNTGLFSKELNENQVNHYLLYKYGKKPETFYQNVKELAPGQSMHIDKGQMHQESFVGLEEKDNTNLQTSMIEELIRDSLVQQINSSVPLGLLLSGGVDSTLLLALAKNEGFTMPTFSIVNSARDSSFGTNDFKYSRKAASLYNSEHHEVEIDISIMDHFDNFIQNMDQPIGDSSYLMTSEICKYASGVLPANQPGIKVLLSGAGADEIFGGYNRHWAFQKYLKHKNILNTLTVFQPIASILPTGFDHPLRKQFRLFKKLAGAFSDSPEPTFHNFLKFNELNIQNEFEERQTFETNSEWISWALDHDLKNYLIGDVLALSDKASMQHGIEMRVPYLDEKLVKYVKSSNPEDIFKNGQKWVLKELLIKQGGKEFANRPKEGFGLPLASWLMDKKMNHLWDFVANEQALIFNFVDKTLLDQLLDQQRKKKADHGPLLWSILTLAHWLSKNFE